MTELNNDERIVLLIEQAEKQQAMFAQQQETIDNTLKALMKLTLDQLRDVDSKYKAIEKQLVTGVTTSLSESVSSVVSDEVKNGLDDSIKDLQQQANSFAKSVTQSTGKLNGAVANVEKHTKNKLLAMWGGALAVVLTLAVVFISFYVPSLDTVAERKQAVADAEKAGAIIRQCDGKACVKIKPNKCEFGTDKDFCVLATK